MDWELVFMVFLSWVVSGGLMFIVYNLGKDSAKKVSAENFDISPVDSRIKNSPMEWRIWLNGMAVITLVAFFGFFFDDRGPNVHMPSHLLGMYLAVGLAFTFGWFAGHRVRH